MSDDVLSEEMIREVGARWRRTVFREAVAAAWTAPAPTVGRALYGTAQCRRLWLTAEDAYACALAGTIALSGEDAPIRSIRAEIDQAAAEAGRNLISQEKGIRMGAMLAIMAWQARQNPLPAKAD